MNNTTTAARWRRALAVASHSAPTCIDTHLDAGCAHSRFTDLLETRGIPTMRLDVGTGHSHLRNLIAAGHYWTIIVDAFSLAQLRVLEAVRLAAGERFEIALQPMGAEAFLFALVPKRSLCADLLFQILKPHSARLTPEALRVRDIIILAQSRTSVANLLAAIGEAGEPN